LRQSFDDPEGMALALNHLGKAALLEKDYPEAQRCFQQGLEIYSTIFDRGGLATSLHGLGNTALKTHQYAEAHAYLQQSLQVAREIQFVPLMLAILVSMAGLLLETGHRERARAVLRFVDAMKASDYETRRQAAALLAGLQHQPAAGRQASFPAKPAATLKGLDALAEQLLAETEALQFEPAQAPPGSHQPDNRHATGMVDALTERELEILRCMNEGLSNKLIADRLILSLGTIKWYTSQIYGKLQVKSRTQALAKVRAMGLL
jgi:ATP/maltotriose-dependent transcriptional regulator MalT